MKKGSMVELTCRHCGKKWIVAYGLRHRQFCSNHCRGKWQTLQPGYVCGLDKTKYSRTGKTNIELFGEQKANEISQKLRESKMGDKNPAKRPDVKEKMSNSSKKKIENGWVSPLKGITFSDERKKEISRVTKIAMNRPDVKEKMILAKPKIKASMALWHSKNKEKFLQYFNNPATRQKMRESHIKAMSEGKYSNKADTDIERFIENYLILIGWEENKDYFKQYPFPEEKPKYLLDFYIPNFKLNIEGMGCYWHKCPKCGYGNGREVDKKRINVMLDHGIRVLNLWSHSMKTYKFENFKCFVKNDLLYDL